MNLSFLVEVILWGIAIGQLILSGVILLLGVLAQTVSRRLLSWTIGRWTRDRDTNLLDDVNRLLVKPLSFLINVALWNVVIGILSLPQEPLNIHLWASRIGMAAMTIVIGYCAIHVIDVFAGVAARVTEKTETKLDDQLVNPISNIVKILTILFLIATVLGQFGYSAAGLIASLSIGGLAVAFAAKDTLANVFGSIVIFSERPFQIGDVVEINGITGAVEEVGIRSTRIRQFDRTISIIPNQIFTTSEICNLSMRNSRRVRFEVTLTHEATVAQLDQFMTSIKDSLEERDDLRTDESMVRLTRLDTSGISVLVQAFTISSDFEEFMVSQEEILMTARKLVEEQALPIMPTKEIRLSGQTKSSTTD